MTEYDICYPSGNTIGFIKKDDEGNIISSFYCYILPNKDGDERLTPLVVVDGQIREEKKYFRTLEPDAKSVIAEYHKWQSDAPPEYATKIGDHIGKFFTKSNTETEKGITAEVGTDGAKVKGEYKKKKQSN